MKPTILAVLIVLFATSTLLTTAAAVSSDHTLKVFGNANMDDTIDEADIEYVQGVIDGTNEETELADANYDGEIDEEDIARIERIIDGGETELGRVRGGDVHDKNAAIRQDGDDLCR